MLGPLLGDRRQAVVVAEESDHGIVAMLALSARPVLRLQGWVGSVEELVVRQGLRDRGVGDRLIQYAKGLAAERGRVRLEISLARRRESNRRSFLFSRGFVAAESVTYRWGMLGSGTRRLPGFIPRAVPSRSSRTTPPPFLAPLGRVGLRAQGLSPGKV